MLALQLACTASTAPMLSAKLNTLADFDSECESLKVRLTKIHDLRRAMLETLMLALTDGKTLLEVLRGIASEGSVDSRPDTMRVSTEFAISQVEHWLESLHDRRQALDLTFNETRSELEQRLALAVLGAERAKIEEFLTSRSGQLRTGLNQLGDSEASSQLFLHEHLKLYSEAKALTKLDQLEVQLTTTTLPPTSQELSVLHAQIAAAAFDVSENAIEQGLGVIDTASNNNAGAEGVKRSVEEIQNRRDYVESLCTAHKEENIKLHQAINNFLEKHNSLYSWLVSRGEAFLQGHQDMGSVLAMARDFCEVHHKLIAELQLKGTEINNLLLTLPPILEQVEDEQRIEIDQKVDALHNLWLHLKQSLECRIDLSAQYLEFHEKAVQLAEQLDSLEDCLRNSGSSQEQQQIVEEQWKNIQQTHRDVKNLAHSFIGEAEKALDPYLDTKRAILCLETLLEHFSGRQITISESKETWQKSVTIEKETRVQWQNILMESTRTVDWVSKLDAQLYPILTAQSPVASTIRENLEKKLEVVLPEVRKAQNEIDERIKNVESLSEKLTTEESQNEDGKDVLQKLTDLKGKLQSVLSDYQVLVQLLLSFFKNVSELEKTIENFQPGNHDAADGNVETLLRDHDASKQAIAELFKFTENESQQIIEKIRQQEPAEAAKVDEEFLRKLLSDKRKAWEESSGALRTKLEKNQQQGAFDRDLAQINYAIADLGRQLEAIRGQYGESLSSAKATSAAFDYFEKTIELLEQRIQNFVSTTKQVQSTQGEKPVDAESSHVEKELKELQQRWSDFRGKVAESRRLIELSIQYFQLVDEAGEWFKEGSHLLVSIARRSAAVRFPESANELLAEMETFLKPGEAKQDERIQKILELAKILYGEDKSQQVSVVLKENREMLDSFSTISKELNNLAVSLSQAERLEPVPDEKIQEPVENQPKEIIHKITTSSTSENLVITEIESETAAPLGEIDSSCHNGDVQPKVEEPSKEEPIVEESSALSNVLQAEERVVIEAMSSDETTEDVSKKALIAPQFTEPLKDASIQEGGKFTFECRAVGSPAPEIVWEKDGISISNNPDYMTAQDGTLYSLTIEETFTEDSARFTCRATNAAGTSETSATLNVIESEPEEQLHPPVFSAPLKDQVAKEGSAHILECTVEGLPLPTVQWYKEENCIDDSPELAITYNNGQAKLKLEQVSLSDQAQYTCKANNSLGTASTSGLLSVEPLKPTAGPSFTIPLSNVMARAGQKIKLECSISGTPLPLLTWTHDGKPLKENRDIKTFFEDGKATLVIPEAFPKDAGTYVVTASNNAAEATSSCTVTVKGRLPTETSDSELASDLEPIKPSIQMSLKDTEVKEGENVRLDCIIVGQPEPEVIWYHNDRPVKESADFQLLFHGDRCSLVLREALPEDAGLYRVVAINSAGEASSQCQLSVLATDVDAAKEMPASESKTKSISEEVVAIAPKFTRLLADVLAADGECVKLACTVEGTPKPSIRWCQNNKDITPSERIKMLEEEDGTIILVIDSVTADDRGVYTARASNSLGEAKCFSNLIVKSALSESKSVELADRQVPPSFKEQFTDTVVLRGAPIKFECIVVGRPAPKVRWLFNEEQVSGKNFLVSKSGDRDVLSIQEADLSGCVSCTAENEAGKCVCSVKLTVEEPDITGLMSEPDEGGVSSLEETSQSFTMKRAVFMQSSSTTTSSSGTGPVQTQAHSVSAMSEQVSKKVDDEPTLQIKSEHKQEVHTVNDESSVKTESSVSVSQGGDERKETVKSTSGSNLPLTSQTPSTGGPAKPTRKSTAPRFVTPLNGKIVDQGADILLEGILDGFPTPTISWTKNGVDIASIPEAASITTSWELNRVRLEMKNVSVKDAGRYTCRADNPVGSASSTADIIVKKTVFPPVMGKRLQVQQARVGERIAMEVEVTGLPEPTITWSKDGLPLSAYPHLEIRTRTQGNCFTLVIDKATLAHAGNYAVRATNAGGEANSSADVAVWEALPDELMDQQQRDVIFRELMDFPAVQKHESFQTSNQSFLQRGGSSSSIVSKEVPVSVISSPANAVAAPSGPAESLHISETTKTEKHFSVKVDRTSSPMLVRPVNETQAKVTTSTFSLGPDHKETNIPVMQEKSTTVVHSRSELDSLNLLPKTSDLTFEKQAGAVDEDSAIDSSSIPTQTALQFFMSKIKESEDTGVSRPAEPVSVPTAQKLTEKISLFERREQEELSQPKSPELKEQIPVTKLTDKISLFENYEGKPEAREETKKFEEQIWKSYKHEPAPEPRPVASLPDFTEPYMPGKQVKTEVQHSRVVQQETKTWSGTIQVPGKIVPSSYTQPITFKEESRTASYQKSFVAPEAAPAPPPDEFGLRPEPPPEMCYTPKPERATKVREDMAERVKKLQDSQKSLDPMQVPTGAVRIFPVNAPPSSQPTTPQPPRAQRAQPAQPEPAQPSSAHTPSFLWPSEQAARAPAPAPAAHRQEEAKEEPMVRQQVTIDDTRLKKNAETVGGGVWTTPTAAAVEVPPLPVTNNMSMSSYTSASSSSFQQTSRSFETSSASAGPILRPAATDVPLRATSPRPAAEAISMERLWTSHRTSESEKTAFAPVSHKPAAQPRPVSDGFTMSDRSFSSEASVYSASATEQRRGRGPSPRPSDEGLAMEKLWAPHKPADVVAPFAPAPVPDRPVSPRPSAEGLSMDKSWAHKAPVKRSWPPPKPSEVEKIAIPWAPQNEPEKVWSPEADARVERFEFEKKESRQQAEVVQGFRPVAAPAPASAPASAPAPALKPLHDLPQPQPFVPLSTSRDVVSSETRSEQFESSWSKTTSSSSTTEQQSSIVEEKHIKPSEAKKIWPPNKPEYDLQAPFMVKKLQKRESRQVKVQAAAEPEPLLYLEPGPPPEMGFAAPPSERRRSMVESIEEDLEKSLEKEPTKVVPGGVRVIPLPQSKSQPAPATIDESYSWKQEKSSFLEKKTSTTSLSRKEESFESSSMTAPLEPFPFQAEPERPRPQAQAPPPPKPVKFAKGDFGGSDYESDLETSRISA
ncbi:Muscle M-line assembly protein unc-89, partial [Frankliniella fusca]